MAVVVGVVVVGSLQVEIFSTQRRLRIYDDVNRCR